MDVSSNLTQASSNQSKAENALKRQWFWSLFSDSNKFEKAAELFAKAANSYKLAKSWDNAGSTYEKLADCHLKLESKYEAGVAHANAAHCYLMITKTDDHGAFEKAVHSLKVAGDLYSEDGNFSMAAKCCKEIAEQYEPIDIMKSIPCYESAIDLYEADKGHTSTANQCRQKVAELAAKSEQYDKAIGLYERIAVDSLKNNLLKHGAAGHFLNAGICHLCKHDVDALNSALEKYQSLDSTFSANKREFVFLSNLASAMKDEDADGFEAVVKEYNDMLPLDGWKTTLLWGVKEKLKASELEEEDLT